MLTDRCFQILESLTEKWAKRYPAIREYRLYLGKDEERPYFLVIVPVDNISEEDLHSLYALVDGFSLGMLRELEHRALDFGCKFNIDQWGCDVDDGRPIPFIATDSYWLLYPKKDEMVEQDTPTDDIQDEISKPDIDDFIRNLIFYPDPENNDRIILQVPGKGTEPFTYNVLGFKRTNTDEWKTFLNILQESNTYYVGQSGNKKSIERREYDRNQGVLKRINKKLITFLRKKFSLQIPEDFKIYELDPEKGTGFYTFIFQTEYDINIRKLLESNYDKLSKDELLKHLKELSGNYLKKPEDWLGRKIKEIKDELILKHEMTENEIKDTILTKKEIEKDFFDYSSAEKDFLSYLLLESP